MNLETTSDTNWPKVSPSQQTPQYTTGVVRPETGLGTPDLLEGEDDEAEPPPPNDAANVATSGRLGQAAEAIVYVFHQRKPPLRLLHRPYVALN